MTEPTPCDVRDGYCQLYKPGHHTHWIHARRVGETPWGWRDAVVFSFDGLWVTVTYLAQARPVQVWHHQDLSAELGVGAPVRLHEGYSVLGGPFGWVNVVVQGGVGPVPTPSDTSAWEREMTGGVQDLRTGRAIALDWHDR